ncbi:MAG: hypothetical protein GVY22_13030 [Gammaproteobacteria bacterium]|jgi:hypothetical protein|nr:hypothetical protein [Gammaproteobacteria bacterium]
MKSNQLPVASLNAEVISNQGQADLTVKLAGFIYVMEIKVRRGGDAARPEREPEQGAHQPANPALAQIRARGYSAKYRGLPNQGLFELGLVFDSGARNLVQADWAQVG